MQKRSRVRFKELYLVMSIVLPFLLFVAWYVLFLFWLLKYFVIVDVVLACNH